MTETIMKCFCDADGQGGRELRQLVEILRHEPDNTRQQSFELMTDRCRYRASAPDVDHWPAHAQMVKP